MKTGHTAWPGKHLIIASVWPLFTVMIAPFTGCSWMLAGVVRLFTVWFTPYCKVARLLPSNETAVAMSVNPGVTPTV